MRRTVLVAAMVIAVAGCKKKEAAPAAPTMRGMPAGMAEAMKGAPAAAPSLKGKVLEKLDASVYSYLRLQTADGEVWAAVPQTPTAVGSEIEVVNPQPMDGFESKTLNKKFDKIVFGSLPGQVDPKAAGGFHATGMMKGGPIAVEPPPEDPKAMAERHAMMAQGPSDAAKIEVPRATGPEARTVAEVWANRGALKQKTVTVRAQVVKVTSGVMGRTWLHVRDGSGTADKRDNDLTVTTSAAAPAAVGDVVVVSGKVNTDRDFGAGYSYPVIVEDAKVAK